MFCDKTIPELFPAIGDCAIDKQSNSRYSKWTQQTVADDLPSTGHGESKMNVRALEIKKLEDGKIAVRWSNKPKKWVIIDDAVMAQFIVFSVTH